MKRLSLIFLLLLIAVPCLAGQSYRRHIEPETVNYCSLSGASCPDQFALNEQNKSIKYNGGSVTLSGLTCNLSLVNGTAFISNPSVDLRKYVGFKITITETTHTLIGYIKSAGTGETLNTNIFASFNFTSGWSTIGGASITDADTFATVASGGITKASVATQGRLYKSQLVTTANNASMQDGAGSFYYSNNGNAYYRTTGSSLAVNLHAGTGQTVDVTTLTIQQVLTPSATGVTIVSTKGGSTYNWTSDSGINPNAASFTAVITKE